MDEWKLFDRNYLMPNRQSPTRQSRQARFFGFLFFLVLLAAGLLLGTESRLTLRRDSAGEVTAMNAWVFAGQWTLISHSLKHLREVKFEEMRLSGDERRSGVYRDGFGWSNTPEVMALAGDGRFTYPYHDDAGLIRGFLKNARNRELVLTHPIDVRRKVASWVLLTVAALSVAGWIWKMALGRDPLQGAERSVKPLPPVLGGAVFVGGIALLLWFFLGIPGFPWDFSNAFSAGVCEEPSLYEASEAIGGRSGSAPCPHPHPVSFKVPPNQVSMGFEGNRMPADQDRNPTEIPEEPFF
jgi:hypothetical protein